MFRVTTICLSMYLCNRLCLWMNFDCLTRIYVCIQEQAAAKAAPVASSPANIPVRLLIVWAFLSNPYNALIFVCMYVWWWCLLSITVVLLLSFAWISTRSLVCMLSSSQLCAVVSFFVAGEDQYCSSRSGSCSSSADGLQGRSWSVCMESCL